MTKLEMSSTGKLFKKSVKACLEWLSIGASLSLASGHILVLTEDGQPGFLMQKLSYGKEEEIVMLIGSDTAWMCLIDHAKKMTEDDITIMLMNCALNER